MEIEEIRKTLIEVIKYLDNYSDVDFSAWLSKEEVYARCSEEDE